MNFLEKSLEDIIIDTDNYSLQDRDLDINGVKKRQVRIGNYGIADVITCCRSEKNKGEPYISITIYELKKEKIDINSYLQALKYAKGIFRYFKKKNYSTPIINICLIGKTIDLHSSFVYLADFNSDDGLSCFLYTYEYEFDGIKFYQHENYNLTKEGF